MHEAAGQDWGSDDEQRLRDAYVGEPPRLEGHLVITDYDPEWPGLYQREANRVRGVLGDRVLRMEHVGSTSVPGLAAKPRIDMLLVVENPADEAAYVPDLENAGYRLVIREPDWHQHRVFAGPDTIINLHVYPPESSEITKVLRFRDHLRNHDADRELYERTKRSLAQQRWTYVQQYADAKTTVIEEILARAANSSR